MERRAFVKGAFGFVALAAIGAVAAVPASNASGGVVTAEAAHPEAARGPAMVGGIELVQAGEVVEGRYGVTHLFDVDPLGGELIGLADGSLSIDELASAASVQLNPADVASFFVTLGQAGFLANTVLVNLTETRA